MSADFEVEDLKDQALSLLTYCIECGHDTDPEVCWCGTEAKFHNAFELGHGFVPMGCTCGYPKEERPVLEGPASPQ